MTLHVVIPCKSLTGGKSRLSPILGAEARQAICTRFLANTIRVALSLVPANRCHVVVADPTAEPVIAAYGATIIIDPGLGLNIALGTVRDRICDRSTGGLALLILPIDLPLADSGALSGCTRRKGDVVIVPDRQLSGTNALLIREPALRRFEFHFGPESFSQHRKSARTAGFVMVVHDDPRLSFDIDEPADYHEWQLKVSSEGQTREPAEMLRHQGPP